MEIVKALLENPAVLTVLAGLVAGIVIMIAKKKPWIEKMLPLAINIYNSVEKLLPDKPGSEKLKTFMEEFVKEYETRTGKTLTVNQKKELSDHVAVIAMKDNHTKTGLILADSIPGSVQ